jgi:hypothetical protein
MKMMRQFLLTVCVVALAASGMFAQTIVKNDGAMFVIEPGATVYIQGGLENVNGGTIDNDGTIEIEGDFVNSATFDGTNENTVIFSGSTASNITSGGAVFHHVNIDKDAAVDVNLMDNMSVKGILTFVADNNKVNIGANDLTITNTGTIASFDANDYVVTDDVGYLRMQGLDAAETFIFPVGNDNATYNPATIAANGGHTGDVFSVRVRDNLYIDGLAETEPATEAAVNAMWDITEGTVGGSDVNITLQWAGSDELPDFPAEVGISRHDGSNWDMLAANIGAPVGTDPYTRTRNNVTSFSAFAVGGEPVGHALALSLKTFLQGGYSGGLISDALRSGSLIPTAEPYEGAPYNYAHVGFGGDETVDASVFTPTGNDAIADWVLIELRDQTTPSIILASKSALIQRDGDIVDLDGVSPLQIHGLADGTYHIGINHRNHLGIRTATAQALSNTPLALDFTTNLALAFDDPGIPAPPTGNNPMKTLSTGIYGLWAGDANASKNVIYNGGSSDRVAILNAVGNTTPSAILPNIYSIFDVNMNGEVKYNGSGADRVFILNEVVGSSSPSKIIAGHQ